MFEQHNKTQIMTTKATNPSSQITSQSKYKSPSLGTVHWHWHWLKPAKEKTQKKAKNSASNHGIQNPIILNTQYIKRENEQYP